jgi:hypothetical protein
MIRIACVCLAVFVLAAVAVPAWAGDLCIDMFVHSARLVGKKLTVPTRNTCKPFNGFLVPGFDFGAMAGGTICTKADGSLLRLHVTTHAADHNWFKSVACNFVLPDMTIGNCRFKDIACDFDFCQTENQGMTDFITTATASRCLVDVP